MRRPSDCARREKSQRTASTISGAAAVSLLVAAGYAAGSLMAMAGM